MEIILLEFEVLLLKFDYVIVYHELFQHNFTQIDIYRIFIHNSSIISLMTYYDIDLFLKQIETYCSLVELMNEVEG